MTANPYKSPETKGYSPPQRTMVHGLVVQSLKVLAIVALLGFLLLPFVRLPRFGAREAARRVACTNNLRHIALALHQYDSKYNCLPPSHTVDATGKPLHSWRTLLLPFLEQRALYDRIDLSKPWDDPVNKAAYETSLKIYQCPSSDTPECHTTYLANAKLLKQTKTTSLTPTHDDIDLTILLMEVADEHAVRWMAPTDIDDELLSKLIAGNSGHPSGAHAAMVSGRVLFLRQDLKAETLRALITPDGKDDAIAKDGF